MMSSRLGDSFLTLFDELCQDGLSDWVDVLRASCEQTFAPSQHGHFAQWEKTLAGLPQPQVQEVALDQPAVSVMGECSERQKTDLKDALQSLHPWRKGPFDVFGIRVDAEWQSDLKWSRVAKHLDLMDKNVLDVGCGNGYYGWRMLGAGAKRVVGLEPYPLYNAQYAALHTFLPAFPNFVLPANDSTLAQPLAYFDVAFSMGVFYHSRDPVQHLRRLRQTLKRGGQLVLETLVIEGDVDSVLLPESRYAKMRNVWLLPSPLFLERLLIRCGFRDVQLVDLTVTSTSEQRSTSWMTFESLADFLCAEDPAKTIEGHPAPLRATLIASA